MTEMLSNAVRHGTPPWGVRMWLFRGDEGPWYVRLEVDDAGPGIDIDVVRARWRHPSGFLAEGGRGLLMVDALASSWGDEPSSHGHTMWAQLEAEPGSAKGERTAADDRGIARRDQSGPGRASNHPRGSRDTRDEAAGGEGGER